MELTNEITVNKRIEEFDFIKGICILFVVTSHSLFVETVNYNLTKFYLIFFSNMAVPMFIIISTFMQVNSYFKNSEKFNARAYFPKRILAILLPYSISYLLEVIFLIILNRNIPVYLFERLGLGSYYVVIQLQLILIIPIYLSLFRGKIYLFPLLLISLCFETYFNVFNVSSNIYSTIVLRYNNMIIMGLILFEKYNSIIDKKSLLTFCLMSLISVAYLTCTLYLGYTPNIYRNVIETSGCVSLLAMFYIILIMKLYNLKEFTMKNIIKGIGRAS